VIHFDRWWNPAVENQATDRAFRIGQDRNVFVYKFVCRGTIEERIDELIASKSALAKELIEGGAEQALTEMDNEQLLRFVSLDVHKALAS
jgi:non-specific serine/threonine protein kinase